MRHTALVLGLAAVTLAAARNSTAQSRLEWLYTQLDGTWSRTLAGGSAATTFTHMGGGVFRVQSNDPHALLARWNGRQVRVSGPLATGDRGWTTFQIDGRPGRIARRKDGFKVLEIEGPGPQGGVDLLQAPGS